MHFHTVRRDQARLHDQQHQPLHEQERAGVRLRSEGGQ